MSFSRTIPRTARDEVRVTLRMTADRWPRPLVDMRLFAPNRAAASPSDLASTSRGFPMKPEVAEALAAALIEAARLARSGGS